MYMVGIIGLTKGPSKKYVTLFLAIFYPLPPGTLRHTSRDPPKVRHTTRTRPPISRRPSIKNPNKSPLVQILFQLFTGVFVPGICQGVFCLEGFVRGGFCPFPFCQNTSVTSGSLTSL